MFGGAAPIFPLRQEIVCTADYGSTFVFIGTCILTCEYKAVFARH